MKFTKYKKVLLIQLFNLFIIGNLFNYRNQNKEFQQMKLHRSIAILGPRQSDKTTLAKTTFPDKPYVSFENPEHLQTTSSYKGHLLKNYLINEMIKKQLQH